MPLIPVVSSAVAQLIPLVPDIVKGVESLFGAKTGDTKMQTATNMLNEAAKSLAAAGKIQGVPDTSSLVTMIEGVVQQLKAQGQLPAPKAPATPATDPTATSTPTTLPNGIKVIIVGTIQQIG